MAVQKLWSINSIPPVIKYFTQHHFTSHWHTDPEDPCMIYLPIFVVNVVTYTSFPPAFPKFLPELLLPQPIASAGLESITYPGISDRMLKRWAMTWAFRHGFDSEEFDNESFPSRGTLTSCYAFFLSFSFFLCGHFENSMNHAVHTWSFVTEKIRKLTQYLKKWRGCKTSFYLCLMASCQVGRESPEYVTQSSFCSYVCSTTKCC